MGSSSQKILIGTMLKSVYENYDITSDDSAVSNLLSCRDNLSPNVTEFISNIEINAIVSYFKKNVITQLHPNKSKLIILAVIDIMLNDSSDNDTIVEIVNRISKEKLSKQTEFVFLDFVVGVFLYTLNISNKDGASCVGEITEAYVDGFLDRQESIKLIDSYGKNVNANGRTNIQNGNNNMMFTGDITGGTFNFNLSEKKD